MCGAKLDPYYEFLLYTVSTHTVFGDVVSAKYCLLRHARNIIAARSTQHVDDTVVLAGAYYYLYACTMDGTPRVGPWDDPYLIDNLDAGLPSGGEGEPE